MKNLFKYLIICMTIVSCNLSFCYALLTPTVDSIPMSDGKKLAADVYIPSGMTTGPVILIQTPYNRLLYRGSLPLGIGLNISSSNYIFVIVDWRGFYGSTAAAYLGDPAIGPDGHDVVEWIANQSFSNGKVGTWGASALGRVQFQTAKTNPPHLTCICPLVAATDYDYVEYFPNGDLRTEYVEQLDALGFNTAAAIMPYPVHDLAWTIVENANDYPDSIRVPCYMIGGWYDHTIEFMLPLFNELRTMSPVNVQNEHRLLMGPWVHKGVGNSTAGQLSYANAGGFSDSLALLFFDYHLRNVANNWDASPFVQYYQMGENAWKSSPTWPPDSTQLIRFNLFKDSVLYDIASDVVNNDSLTFDYDPTDPSPTIGGPTLRVDLVEGPYNQAPVESRNDILTFTTPTLTQNAVMKGNAIVHLKVASKTKDTDFDVRLTDVYPNDSSMLVNDGCMRMRFRNGITVADTAAMIPDAIYDCMITLPNTCITFLTGHRIRLDVTSSNYPLFNRNMNTDGNMYPNNSLDTLVNAVTTTNTVYMNTTNTSYISLPLVGFSTGIAEVKNNISRLTIYPDPASSFINLSPAFSKDCEISIYNMLGQNILQVNNQSTIDVSALSKGLYFLRAKTRGSAYSAKFVRE